MKLSLILDLKPKSDRIVSVDPDTPIQDAIDVLCRHDAGAVVVLAPNSRRLVGVLSDRDILRSLCSREARDLSTLKVSDLMTEDVLTAAPGEEAHRALALMTKHHVSHLPVVQRNEVLGMISQRDILRELQRASEARVHSLSDYLGGTYGSNVY